MPIARRASSGRAAANVKRVKYAESDDGDEDDSSASPPTEEDSGSEFGESQADAEEAADDEDDDEEDSDNEVSSEEEVTPKRKRGKSGGAKTTPIKAKVAAQRIQPDKVKASRKRLSDDDEDFEGNDQQEDDGLVGGETLSVTKLVAAPTLRHSPGQLGRPVIDFMTKLLSPKYNDREWFHANERVWKWIKQDFDEFSSHFLERLMDEVDETVPYLPSKDMVYRIHRDVRFSNDKTPYKRTLMATLSRGGRKGPFAGYHLCVRAGGESGLHAGTWEPPPDRLNVLRDHIKEETEEFKRFKAIIEDPEFVKVFGAPKPDIAKGVKGSLWGRNELKSAPKGIDKTHPHIHLLRLKTFCVSRHFTDAEVVDAQGDADGSDDAKPVPKQGKKGASTAAVVKGGRGGGDDIVSRAGSFESKLVAAARMAKDFVEVLNDMMHPAPPPPPGFAGDVA